MLYGYVRGSHLKPGMKVHLIGAGDFAMASVDALADPCPLPEKERSSLKSKETLLYAPMANVGAVRYDADAMYIDLRRLHYTKVRRGVSAWGCVFPGFGRRRLTHLDQSYLR